MGQGSATTQRSDLDTDEFSAGGSILGISVIDDQISSVVRGADGGILASNVVDLPDPSSQAATTAVTELIESVPFEIDRIGVCCARPATQNYLASAFTPGSGRPGWYQKVWVSDIPSALGEVARLEMPDRGIVAAIDLDRNAVPSPGLSIVTVDSATGEVLGISEFAYGSPGPVTESAGAGAAADAIRSSPGGSAVTSVVLTGAGADVLSAASAIEHAVGRSVAIAHEPELATAVGAAVAAHRVPITKVGAGSARRWWLIGGAAAAALLVIGVTSAAVFAGVSEVQSQTPPTTSTVTVTAKPVTRIVTKTPPPRTETITETEYAPAETITRTTRVPAPNAPVETETVTETATVTEYAGNGGNQGGGNQGGTNGGTNQGGGTGGANQGGIGQGGGTGQN